jgi:hypothetical protein
MAYEDVRLALGVNGRAALSLAATGPKLTMDVLARRSSSVTVKQGAALTLRVVDEAI